MDRVCNVGASVAGWLTPLAWMVWGVGFVLLALGAAALHALIAMAHRKGSKCISALSR